MRLLIKLFLVPCILVFLFVERGAAGPVAYGSVAKLTAEADAIVVGSIQSEFVAGTVSGMIQVEKVLKGVVTPGTSISVTWTSLGTTSFPSSGKSRSQTSNGVFFLLRNANGSWSLMPVANGDIGAGGTYIHTPSNPPPGLRDVAAASLPASATPLDKVLAEFVVAVEAGAAMPFDLIAEFRESGSPVLSAAFARFLQNPKLMALGLRGSILSGDTAPITIVRQNYASLSLTPGWFDLLQEIRSYYVNTAPQAIQTLGQIAIDGTVGRDLRIAAGGALARMHTQATLPYLARLLGDKDIELRTTAAGGMGSFANNVPIGSHEPAAGPWPYRTNDTIFHSGFNAANVTFWQDWWQQNQSKLTQ